MQTSDSQPGTPGTPAAGSEPPSEQAPSEQAPPSGPALSADDLITLNDQIAGMARAGLPLDQGLAALAQEMRGGRLKQVTAELAEELRAGRTLPEALARQGSRLPPFYASLLTAGIRSGRIGEVLQTMTAYARTVADLRATVMNSLFYPVMVFGLSLGLFGLLFFLVVPEFETVFHGFRMQLPWITQVLFTLSHYPAYVIVAPLVLLVGYLVGVRLFLRRNERGRRVWANWVYAVPLVGTLLRSARLAAFTELLSILVENSVPLPEALRLAGASAGDRDLNDAARQAAGDVEQGVGLGEALRRQPTIPQVFTWMAALGEMRGRLAAALRHLADLYRRQVEMRAALLKTVLPPLMIIVTAVLVVGLFVVLLGIPLFHLLHGLSGG